MQDREMCWCSAPININKYKHNQHFSVKLVYYSNRIMTCSTVCSVKAVCCVFVPFSVSKTF